MTMSFFRIWLPVLALLLTVSAGCSRSDRVTVVDGGSKKLPLDSLQVQQFATPLPIIPVASPDTTTSPGSEHYTVVAEQTDNYDFGLRKKDGSEFINPLTNGPLRTTVWGYTVNGIRLGYLGATIEASSTLPGESGKPTRVTYVNNLRSSSGSPLTKHLLTVDPTLGGSSMGAPEIRLVTHLHGGHVAPEFDGHPETWITNDPNYPGLAADPVRGRPARPAGNTVTYTYDNDQKSEHLWFHDHAMGITRLNVYAGLAANYLMRDKLENGLNLPRGAYEIPLVIQDKTFNQDGSLRYGASPLVDEKGNPVLDDNGKQVFSSDPEFFGSIITVNGKAWPYLAVEPRKYRFRVLNGSDSRFYNIWLERSDSLPIPAGAIMQIGNDGGLMPAAVEIGTSSGSGLLLGLGERADVIIDFSKFPAGTSITVRNDAPTPFPNGDAVNPSTTGRIMQFMISRPLANPDSSVIPAAPRPPVHLGPPVSPVRYVDLQETMEENRYLLDQSSGMSFQRLKILLNGLAFDAPITEKPRINDVEDWVIINNTVDMHPMHLHLVDFEVIEKGSVAPGAYTPADGKGGMPSVAPGGLRPDTNPDGSPADHLSHYRLQPHEAGDKDTVRVPPADEAIGSPGYIRIRAKFDRLGTYMWHCHILAHEDNEMMRPFMVVP